MLKAQIFITLTQDVLEGAGLPAYEVSNHAAVGEECKHNQLYWHMADYIGVGAGAHGRFMMGADKYAARDHSAPDIWLDRVEAHGYGAHEWEVLSKEDRFAESLIMGLRVRSGISIERCESLSNLAFFDQVDQEKIEVICAQKWANYNAEEGALSLTREGILRLNSLIPYLLK